MARPRSDIVERIVHAARDRFLADGVDGASLRQIAKDAETNIGMIYYYFKTKDDLFLAVVEERYTQLLVGLEQAVSSTEPFETRVRALYKRVSQMTDEDLVVMQIIFREFLVSNDRRNRLITRFGAGHIPLMVQLVMSGIASGDLDPKKSPAVQVISMLVLGFMPQMMRRLVPAHAPLDPLLPKGEALADALADVLLQGVGAKT